MTDRDDLASFIDENINLIRRSNITINPDVATLSEIEKVISEYVITPPTRRYDDRKNVNLVLKLILEEGSWLPTFGPNNCVSIFQLTERNEQVEYKVTFIMIKTFGEIYSDYKHDYESELKRAVTDVPCASEMINKLIATFAKSQETVVDQSQESIQQSAIHNAYKAFVKSGLSEQSFAALTFFSFKSLVQNRADCNNVSVLTACVGDTLTSSDYPIIYIGLVGNQEEFSVDENVSKTYQSVKGALPGGSCTMLMTLLFHCLTSLGYNVICLQNYGGIGGCKCYTASAETNSLYAFKGMSFTKLQNQLYDRELIRFIEDECDRFEGAGKEDGMYFVSPYVLFNTIRNIQFIKTLEECYEEIKNSNEGIEYCAERVHNAVESWQRQQQQQPSKRRRM